MYIRVCIKVYFIYILSLVNQYFVNINYPLGTETQVSGFQGGYSLEKNVDK